MGRPVHSEEQVTAVALALREAASQFRRLSPYSIESEALLRAIEAEEAFEDDDADGAWALESWRILARAALAAL